MAAVVNNSSRSSLFVNSPGKARATIPGHGVNADGSQGVGGFLNKKGKPVSSPTKGNKAKRYFKRSVFKSNGPETNPTCSTNSCFQSIVEPAALAGRLKLFLPNWQKITVDPAILDVVRGYKLEFLSPPIQEYIRNPLQFSHAESEKIDSRLLPYWKKEP